MNKRSEYLIEPIKTDFSATTLWMYSARGSVYEYHKKYSLLPFIRNHLSSILELFPHGLVLKDVKAESCQPEINDYFICADPNYEDREFILDTTRLFDLQKTLLINYENTIAYHYHAWRMHEQFSSNFSSIFSSVANFADSVKYFWIPNWNFAINFETGQPTVELTTNLSVKSKFLAINPIRTGITVSPRRMEIIKNFFEFAPESEIYGMPELFKGGELSQFNKHYVGELPYSSQPYRFQNKVPIFKDYKFILVIENTFVEGYISEKLAEPLAALTVPVYFGNKNISEYLPKLFIDGAINGHSFNNPAQLVTYLKNMSDSEYHARQEKIKATRSEYFELTSRINIWEYALSHLFNLKKINSASIFNQHNLKLSKVNKQLERQKIRQEITDLVHRENYDPAYEIKIANLFKMQI